MKKTASRQTKATAKYHKKTYAEKIFYIRNNEYPTIEKFRISNNYSTNGLVNLAVKEKIERMAGEKFEDLLQKYNNNIGQEKGLTHES